MKQKKGLLLILVVVLLIVCIGVTSFEAGVRYANMESQMIRDEFLRDRPGQIDQGIDARPTPRAGTASNQNQMMEMIHEMIGIGR